MRGLNLDNPVKCVLLIAVLLKGWTFLPGALGACSLGACIKEDTCLQSAVSSNSPGTPLLVSICGNVVLGTSIKIGRPVTINSSCQGGPCTVSLGGGLIGKDLPLFTTNSNLTLRNLVLQGGKAISGGAIQVDSSTASVACANVTFQSNNAQVAGGAVSNLATGTSGTASFTDCLFLANSATTTDGTGIFGGAIYWPGPLRVQGCNFTANSADQGGGAVYFNGSSPSSAADIRGSLFFQNSVNGRNQGFGGAVFATGLAPLILSGNTFAYNQIAKGSSSSLSLNGGAIYAEVPVLGAGNIIQNNSATSFGLGGGLQLSGADNVFCGPSINISGNTASRGSDVYMTNRVSASFCPGLPAETAVLGSTVTACSQCTCASGFCHPLATCQPVNGSGFTCTCQAGYFGNGYYCDTVAPIVAGVRAVPTTSTPPLATSSPASPAVLPPQPTVLAPLVSPAPTAPAADTSSKTNYATIIGVAAPIGTVLAVLLGWGGFVLATRDFYREKDDIIRGAVQFCKFGARVRPKRQEGDPMISPRGGVNRTAPIRSPNGSTAVGHGGGMVNGGAPLGFEETETIGALEFLESQDGIGGEGGHPFPARERMVSGLPERNQPGFEKTLVTILKRAMQKWDNLLRYGHRKSAAGHPVGIWKSGFHGQESYVLFLALLEVDQSDTCVWKGRKDSLTGDEEWGVVRTWTDKRTRKRRDEVIKEIDEFVANLSTSSVENFVAKPMTAAQGDALKA